MKKARASGPCTYSCACLNIFLVKTDHEASARNVVLSYLFINQSKHLFQVRFWSCQDGKGRSKFNERFSETVRQFPVVYDKSCKDFKDRNKQSQAWENIASSMAMKMVKVHLFLKKLKLLNFFLMQTAKLIAIYGHVGRLRIRNLLLFSFILFFFAIRFLEGNSCPNLLYCTCFKVLFH